MDGIEWNRMLDRKLGRRSKTVLGVEHSQQLENAIAVISKEMLTDNVENCWMSDMDIFNTNTKYV